MEEGANRITLLLDIRDSIAGRADSGAVEYVRETARGRDELTMVDSSTETGCADETAGTTGVLNRIARDRREKSML